MAKIKVDGIAPITITTIEDFNISGVTNLKLVKIVGKYTDNSGFDMQTPTEKNIIIIPNVYRVEKYWE